MNKAFTNSRLNFFLLYVSRGRHGLCDEQFNPLMHNYPELVRHSFKNLAAFAAGFLKYVCPFQDVIHSKGQRQALHLKLLRFAIRCRDNKI